MQQSFTKDSITLTTEVGGKALPTPGPEANFPGLLLLLALSVGLLGLPEAEALLRRHGTRPLSYRTSTKY